MENEEEKNNAEVQTATGDVSTGTNKENNKQNNSEGDIANAFGNTEESAAEKKEDIVKEGTKENETDANNAENKDEKKSGSKANSVAIQNKDGSITFKNQKELNGFIAKMYAKGATKAENDNQELQNPNADQKNEGQASKEDGINPNEEEQNQSNQNNSEATAQLEKDYTDTIALAMVEADVNPKRARAASRLIDTSKVIINGVLDNAKLQEEINSLISEWPELKNVNQATQDRGFKFGGAGQSDENLEDNQIAQIFGNN